MTTDKSGRTSAGILLWRSRKGRLEVLLAHQGGPFWVKKDIGHWTIPKGEVEPGEELVAVARREFAEETGHQTPNHPLIDLGQITQKSGKRVLGWAVEGVRGVIIATVAITFVMAAIEEGLGIRDGTSDDPGSGLDGKARGATLVPAPAPSLVQ